MAELWPTIRHKFASALTAWHPSDSSAHVILAPWAKVGGVGEWCGVVWMGGWPGWMDGRVSGVGR